MFDASEFILQVSEVLTRNKNRLSVNGWFHGPPVSRPDRHVEVPAAVQTHVDAEEKMIREWISDMYLDEKFQRQIQENFETDCEVELRGFLKVKQYISWVIFISQSKVTNRFLEHWYFSFRKASMRRW